MTHEQLKRFVYDQLGTVKGNIILGAVEKYLESPNSHGDRVYSYDYIEGKPIRCYGTLYKNEDFPEVSEWYIEYDDGQECAVLDMSLVFKA